MLRVFADGHHAPFISAAEREQARACSSRLLAGKFPVLRTPAPRRNFATLPTSEIASGSEPGIDATKKIPGEGFKRAWPPLIKMDAAVKAKMEN